MHGAGTRRGPAQFHARSGEPARARQDVRARSGARGARGPHERHEWFAMSVDSSSPIVLEVCIASVDDACEAVVGGADRLELNAALELGGATPSAALLAEVKQAVHVPIIAMVRPRGAGFVYRDSELRVMLRDAEMLLAGGADGIAWGAQTAERHVAAAACAAMVKLAGTRATVFSSRIRRGGRSSAGGECIGRPGCQADHDVGQATTALGGQFVDRSA